MTSTTTDTPKVVDQEYDPAYPVEQLTYLPGNPNQGDLGCLMESIATNDFYGAPVVQRGTGIVIAGNHRIEAARQLGLTHLPVILVEATEEEVYRKALVDNESAAKASRDEQRLADLLTTLAATEIGLEGTGYDGDDLDRLLADLNREEPGVTQHSTAYRVVVDCDTSEQADELVERLKEDWGLDGKKEVK